MESFGVYTLTSSPSNPPLFVKFHLNPLNKIQMVLATAIYSKSLPVINSGHYHTNPFTSHYEWDECAYPLTNV